MSKAQRTHFRSGDFVTRTRFDGSPDGPYAVAWCDGTVTFVRAPGGTLIALPTYRLRIAEAEPTGGALGGARAPAKARR